MQVLAQQKSSKASFLEKKYIAILDKPLDSSGELAFQAPDRLEKRTLKPHPESLVLDGDQLSVNLRNKRPMVLRLHEHPEIAAIVESIRGALSGDKDALEKNYSVEFLGVPSKWQLTLVPLNPQASKVVSKIRMDGTQANIKTIVFEQSDGDRSEMSISPISSP